MITPATSRQRKASPRKSSANAQEKITPTQPSEATTAVGVLTSPYAARLPTSATIDRICPDSHIGERASAVMSADLPAACRSLIARFCNVRPTAMKTSAVSDTL